MAKETVTQSKRFYCKSLTPDICKTPVGNTVVPKPYNIIGEFKDAVAVSASVKTHSEAVILHGRSFIPSIKGDAQGVLGGIKSGTFLNAADTLEHSSTKGSNGTDTIQVGRKMWMNAKNTVGRIFQRGEKEMRDLLKPYTKDMDAAAEKLNQAGDSLMDAGGDLMTTAAVLEAGAGISAATGVGLPVAAVAAPTGVAVGAVGGVATVGGAAAQSTGTALNLLSSYVKTGVVPDVSGAVLDQMINTGERILSKKIPGVQSLMDKLHKRRAEHKANTGGGKTEKPKEVPKDKPSDCCPKDAGPGKKVKTPKPVHVGTGEEILHQTDFVLESANSFVWTRCYRSGSEAEDWGLLGARWSTPFSSSLSVCKQGIVYHEDSGRPLRLPTLAVGEAYDHRSEGFVLQRDSETEFSVVWRDGSTDRFIQEPDGWLPHGYQGVNARLSPRAPVRTQRYYLAFSTARDGTYTAIERFHQAQPGEVLMRIHAVDGQVIEAIRDTQDAPDTKEPTQSEEQTALVRMPPTPRIGRVEELRPDGSRICHVRYTYQTEPEDAAALGDIPAAHYKFAVLPKRYNLVTQTNVLGEQRTYSYQHHLLMRYTNYSDFADGLAWISLAALRERWAGSTLSDEELLTRYPITLANSYQAQATRNITADGNGEVIIDYIAPYRTRVTESGSGVWEYTFNSQWLCTHVHRIAYDGTAPQSLGRRDWDSNGQLIADIDSEGNTTRYTYDDAGNLTSITNPRRHTTHIDYNDQNLPIAVTDALGNVVRRSFDAQGRITLSTDALGRTTSYAYDTQGRLSTLTDAKGGVKHLAYDGAGRPVRYTDCSQLTSHYAYNEQGRLAGTTDALGQTTAYLYDALGRVTQVTYPDNTTEIYTYNSDGNLLRHTNAKGQLTRYRYNGHGLPITRIDAKGQTLQYQYDKALRLTCLTNANGETYRLTYDAESRLLSETGFDGKTTTYTYDKAGQLVASECRGLRTDYLRDALGQLQAKITPDATTRYAYDALERLTAVASPHAQQHFIYDSAGQLIEERMAYALSSLDSSDAPMPHAGHLPQPPAVTHAFKLTHTYDELGNRLKTTLPNGRTIDTQRYGSGHWHGTLWQGRTLVDLERDHLHREITRHWGAKQPLSNYRSYDPQSRLKAISLHKGPQRISLRSYSYDSTGQLDSITDSQHGLTTYSYDPLGQLLAALQPHIRETFAFDPAGNLLDQLASNTSANSAIEDDATLPLGKQRPLQEQPAPRSPAQRPAALARVTHNLLKQYLGHSYEYDIQGNTVVKRCIATALPSANQASETSFAYDADNRLVRATRIWAKASGANAEAGSSATPPARQTAHYRYDAFGRRIAKRVIEQGAGPTTVHTTVFVWDGDVLIQEISASDTVTYVYEPGSFVPLARVQSREGLASYAPEASAMHLSQPQAWQIPQDRHAADAHVECYRAHLALRRERRHQRAWQKCLDSASVKAASDTVHYYQCDHLGTPLSLMDAQGTVVWAARYKAWGRVLRYDRNEVAQPLRFQGQYEDAETGLYYNRHRYYDPDQARYLTQDPIGLLGGLNSYQYAHNSTAWVDPLGLAKTKGGCDPCCGKDPASSATKWQGNGDPNNPYKDKDTYANSVLKKGTVLYTLHPYGPKVGNYFADSATVLAAGGSARRYNDSVQVAHKENWTHVKSRDMRTELQGFVLTEDICVGKGTASKNIGLGNGGGTQYFVEDADKFKLLPSYVMKLTKP